jgi:hypothetical protein
METISPPDERRCERCGRVERWDDAAGTWVAAAVDGTRQRGEAHCVHEWNITAAYNPLNGE